jgi:hypothetical protein
MFLSLIVIPLVYYGFYRLKEKVGRWHPSQKG